MLWRVERSLDQQIVDCLPQLLAFCLKLTKNMDQAEDLVQETIVLALAHQNRFDGINLIAWLFVIARNKLRTDWRKQKRMQEDPDDKLAHQLLAPDNPQVKLECEELLRLVDKLPDEQRIPLLLIAEGASYEEAAAEIVEHVGTVKSRLNRARSMLGFSSRRRSQPEVTENPRASK